VIILYISLAFNVILFILLCAVILGCSSLRAEDRNKYENYIVRLQTILQMCGVKEVEGEETSDVPEKAAATLKMYQMIDRYGKD